MSAQRLLAFVALQGQPVQRSFVAGCLYLDNTEERAAANLRSALWRLRQPGLDLIDAGPAHLRLAAGLVVDLHAARAKAQLLTDPARRADMTSRDIDATLFQGDLLPDWYDDWVITARERLRQLRLHALEALCDHLTVVGDFARAIDIGLTAVGAEPLRESAHRALIKAHLAEGNRAEALRHYRMFREVLLDELGVEPTPGLTELVGIGATVVAPAQVLDPRRGCSPRAD